MALSHLSPLVRIHFGQQGVSWIGKVMAVLCKWDWGLKYDRVPYRNASEKMFASKLSILVFKNSIELQAENKACPEALQAKQLRDPILEQKSKLKPVSNAHPEIGAEPRVGSVSDQKSVSSVLISRRKSRGSGPTHNCKLEQIDPTID